MNALLLRLPRLVLLLGLFCFSWAAQAATFTVTNDNDSGPGSLRQAVIDSGAAGGTINFNTGAPDVTIMLASEIVVSSSTVVIIDATALPAGLTLVATNGNRHFSNAPGSLLWLTGVNLTGGGGAGAANSGVGGAIYNQGSLTLTGCSIYQNTAGNGAGMLLDNGSTTVLVNCTIAGNNAGYGSGINCYGSLTLTHCTITGNTGTAGTGGIVLSSPGSALIRNTIVAANIAPGTGDADFGGGSAAVTRQGNNWIGVQPGQYTSAFPTGNPNANGDYVGTSGSPLAPNLAPLGSYGGPVLTMPPNAGSPVIDKVAAGNAAPNVNMDARGNLRSQDGDNNGTALPDIGAVEFFKTSTALSITNASNPIVFGQSFTMTVKVSPVAGGSVPDGTVNVLLNGSMVGSGQLDSTGQITFSTNGLTGGTVYTVSANYLGSSSFWPSNGSLSPNLSVLKALSTITLTSSAATPVQQGALVNLVATVSAIAPGSGTPTGTLTFFDNGSPILSPITLVNGTATFSTANFGVTTHNITASYSGSGSFNSSITASQLSFTVCRFVKSLSDNGTGSLRQAISNATTEQNPGTIYFDPALQPLYVDSVTPVSATSLRVHFIAPVGSAAVTGGDDYLIDGTLVPSAASLGADGQTVTLTMSPLVAGSFHSLNVVGAAPLSTRVDFQMVLGRVQSSGIVSPLTISLTSFTSNPNGASALVISNTAGVTLDASTLPGGITITGTNGGGTPFRLFEMIPGISLSLVNVRLTNGGGLAFAGFGGAIWNNGGHLTLKGCTLSGNIAQYGGAVADSSTGTGTFSISNCTFSGNSATLVGGAAVTGGPCTVVQCTFFNNTARVGGALFFEGNATLTHCTIMDNQATNGSGATGGGICIQASSPTLVSVTLGNSIVAGNSAAGSAQDIYNGGSITGQGANIVQTAIHEDTSSGGGALTGTILQTDPMLGPLQFNGGPTQTMLPLLGSPAIDQGLSDFVLTTDQRGQLRPLGPRPDLGAVEAPVIIVNTATDELTTPASDGVGVSLREAIRDIPGGGTILFDPAIFTGATLAANTITTTLGPLNAQQSCTLDGSQNHGGINIVQVPTFLQQPQSVTALVGSYVPFQLIVQDINTQTVLAGWRYNGTLLGQPDTTEGVYLGPFDAGSSGIVDAVISEVPAPGILSLKGTTLSSFSAVSQPAVVTLTDAAVTIQSQPLSTMLAVGGGVVLSVAAFGPPPPAPALTYQWLKNGVKIAGATKSSYPISNAQLAAAGTYTCVVAAGLKSVTSHAAEIGVVDTSAHSVFMVPGGTFAPAVKAAGHNLAFSWKRDNTTLASTAASFTVKPLGVGDEGLYTCAVVGSAGFITTGFNTQLHVISGAPHLVKPLSPPTAFIGQTYYYQIPVQAAANAAAASFSVAGALPPGLTLNSTTGLISGRPTATKTGGYAVTLKATNAKGSDTSAVTTFNVVGMRPGWIGNFSGYVTRSTFSKSLGGRLDFTVAANGMCTGSIVAGTRPKVSFVNQLLLSSGQNDLDAQCRIPGLSLPDGTPVTAILDLPDGPGAQLILVVPDGSQLVIPVENIPWSATNKATAYAGAYSAVLDPGVTAGIPQGTGFCTFTVSTLGTLTLAGKLPDGSALTLSSAVNGSGLIPVFQAFYGTPGSIVGGLSISTGSTPAGNAVADSGLTWYKPPQATTSTDTVYKSGFNTLSVTAAGSPYVAPAAGARLMGAAAATGNNGNSTLGFNFGGLDVEVKTFSQAVRIDNPKATGLTNTATVVTPAANSTALPVLTAATGAFSGSFAIAGTTPALKRTAPFYGQMVTISGSTRGYGFFLLPKVPSGTQTVATSPKLSGRVLFTAP